MISSIYFDTMNLRQFIIHIKGSQVRISKLRCISIPEGCFISANSVDTGEMSQNVAFQYPFSSLVYNKYRSSRPCDLR